VAHSQPDVWQETVMPLQKDGVGLAGILSARHKAGRQSNINPEPRRSRKEAIA
jgi:hypothetical protein